MRWGRKGGPWESVVDENWKSVAVKEIPNLQGVHPNDGRLAGHDVIEGGGSSSHKKDERQTDAQVL